MSLRLQRFLVGRKGAVEAFEQSRNRRLVTRVFGRRGDGKHFLAHLKAEPMIRGQQEAKNFRELKLPRAREYAPLAELYSIRIYDEIMAMERR
jgi:hypothetical protein